METTVRITHLQLLHFRLVLFETVIIFFSNIEISVQNISEFLEYMKWLIFKIKIIHTTYYIFVNPSNKEETSTVRSFERALEIWEIISES